ncbi:hypothetical protein MKW98_023281 [Papaver atlanticum]|uniref:RNA helicase aquarius N-terminal domain-containing protein n=1 Tax=Papaver atlanticum TaxID=357466 RepID=A0AAD4TCQ1_9MAGN|nr:hypothetical protein MKW98_023281 [Papaver atlanticum]
MPKVHGSGTHSHNFKRKRIGEYPAGISYLSPEKKPLSTNPFNPDLAKEIYESELSVKQSHNKTVSFHRVMNLEFRENIAAWMSFSDNLAVDGLVGKDFNIFQSLEDDIVYQTVLKLASLRVWSCLSHVRFQMEMCLDSNLIKKWHKMIKKQSKEAENRGEPFDLLSKLKVRFVKNLIEEFLESKVLALANVGLIRSDLTKKLSVLSPEELQDLVCNKLKLVSSKDPWAKRVDFLLEVMVSFLEKRQSQKEAINALPLYPNEQITWDESLVPSMNYSGEGCLALPKLNLQFLALHDYLLRIFNLFRLESTLELREDIQEAVQHLLAYLNVEGEKLLFEEFRIKVVKQPNVGEVKPASVTEDVIFTQDVLFLLSICPSSEALSSEEAAKLTVPESLSLKRNFRAILEPIRDLVNEFCIVPDWLHCMFLGYGNPSAAQWTNMPDFLGTVDFNDTFLDADHLRISFPHYQFPKALKGSTHVLLGNTKLATDAQNDLIVEAYVPPDPGLYLQNQPIKNSTPQVGAIISVIQPGLTIGPHPPGTGKTNTDVQILNVLYHNCPAQRTLIITHSNQALNDPFEKIIRQGRVNAMLVRGLDLLSEVERLARSLQLPEDVALGFELLKFTADRGNYLMTKQAKIVAMTWTHAALMRKDFLHAQILDFETSISMLLQSCEEHGFPEYSHVDHSLFARFVRHGIPYIELNAEGRARPNTCQLCESKQFSTANAGFAYDYQLVDVPDYNGRGESAPSPWFYQNEEEAEYIVSKLLIRDVVSRRCLHPFVGPPNKNEFILLSLVHARFVLLLAIFGCTYFVGDHYLNSVRNYNPPWHFFLKKPDKLGLVLHETTLVTDGDSGDIGKVHFVSGVEEMAEIVKIKTHQVL